MKTSLMLLLLGICSSAARLENPPQTKIWSPAIIDRLEEGDHIGLVFKDISIQLEIDARLRVFQVHTPQQVFSFSPGDKLVHSENEDQYIFSPTWRIISIEKDFLLLENEMIQGHSKRNILVHVYRNTIGGFYKSQSPSGSPFLYSYFVELAAL